jgi:hypothetical protein
MSNCNPGCLDPADDACGRDTGIAICLYAFVDAFVVDPRALSGDLETLRHRAGSICALIDMVVLDEYCGTAGERNLSDLAWLAPRARRHAEIVQAAMRNSPVFPIPFATLYRSLDSLDAFMRRYEAIIARFLRNVEGRSEWGLKATFGPNQLEDLEGLARDTWPEWSLLAPGTRYMRMCSQRPVLVAAGRERAASRIDEIVAELRPLAAEVRCVGHGETAGSAGGEIIGTYALLVNADEAAALSERLDQARPRAAEVHVDLTLTGPWPAFSFRPNLPAIDMETTGSMLGDLRAAPAS